MRRTVTAKPFAHPAPGTLGLSSMARREHCGQWKSGRGPGTITLCAAIFTVKAHMSLVPGTGRVAARPSETASRSQARQNSYQRPDRSGPSDIRVAHPFSPKAAFGAMPWNENGLVTHGPQTLNDAVDELLVVALRKVRAADAAGKQHIPTNARLICGA